MTLEPVERMSAILLAKAIAANSAVLDVKGELPGCLRRLYEYGIFTVSEISDIANVSEYQVRQAISGKDEVKGRGGVGARHLDHIVRMVGDPEFAKKHTRFLVKDGATTSALARVTGLPRSSIGRWAHDDNPKSST